MAYSSMCLVTVHSACDEMNAIILLIAHFNAQLGMKKQRKRIRWTGMNLPDVNKKALLVLYPITRNDSMSFFSKGKESVI